MNDSPRVREAKAADRAEMQAVVNRIVRSDEDRAAWMIAQFEAETGHEATDADWEAAREEVRKSRR